MSLIDSHCHLDFPDFASELEAVLARARAAGVREFVTISTMVERYEAYRDIAVANNGVFFTIGTHPNYAHEEKEVSAETLVLLSKHPKCIGIGEAGLDYHYDKVPREKAQRVFRTHIQAARVSGLPLIIHARNADADMAAILREEMGQGAFTAVLHCFTSTPMLAKVGVELGLYLSFSGVITFKNSQSLRDIAAEVPMERLLVETDAPFLAPTPHRGKRNEPAFVAETAKVLAQVKGVSADEIADVTRTNTLHLFAKMSNFEGNI